MEVSTISDLSMFTEGKVYEGIAAGVVSAVGGVSVTGGQYWYFVAQGLAGVDEWVGREGGVWGDPPPCCGSEARTVGVSGNLKNIP